MMVGSFRSVYAAVFVGAGTLLLGDWLRHLNLPTTVEVTLASVQLGAFAGYMVDSADTRGKE